MPRRKKITLKYRKENSILSDVLPYEVPVTFTNRHFYDFIVSNGIEYKNERIYWCPDDKALDQIIRLLFGIGPSVKPEKEIKADGSILKYYEMEKPSIPFSYKIAHKQKEYRELAVPHPRNQIELTELYHCCKELILYYCSISPFSIRQPKKISKYTYHKDRVHYEGLSDDKEGVEEHDKEYENLRSFFVYRDYSNIYKFYESYRYHRCEKKYNRLLILDISKCFESIYTHSLGWALLGKNSVKEKLTGNRKAIDKTFAGRFDKLMQRINYGETNGIIIGPEFSRIFAELILQSVDKAVLRDLRSKHRLLHKKDYEMFRYVDDYFIFFDDPSVKENILEVLQIALKEYKLYLNFSKAKDYEKPIITEISMAKNRIASFLGEKLVYKLENVEENENPKAKEKSPKRGDIYINSTALITQFKTVIKECNVEYKDVLNYSFGIVERRCDRILKNYGKASEDYRSEKKLVQAIVAILEFTFFLYSVSPRVNTTIKLCRILRIFISFMKAPGSNKDFRDLIFKYIYDDVCFILKKNRSSEHIQVETLYLLTVLSELGRDYWLEQGVLADYFNINRDESREFSKTHELNYFSITVMLFYMKEKKRYDELRTFVEKVIISKFQDRNETLRKDAELIILLLDTISCPYVSFGTKKHLLEIYGVTKPTPQLDIINRRHRRHSNKKQLWFTTWEDFNFGKALDAKQSREVY